MLGAWLVVYYRAHVEEHENDKGEPNVGLVVPLLNVHAYLLGAVALALPPWIAVTMTVASVLLLTGRDQLHALARWLEMKEIVTAGQFLILTGIVLPLLPNHPVTTLTAITPRQVWLALIVVCTFSYVSYLAQRYWAAAAGGLWMAALGGLYSRPQRRSCWRGRRKPNPRSVGTRKPGITLATAIMYLRILAVIAIFNLVLARQLALPLGALVACRVFDLRAAISVREAARPDADSATTMPPHGQQKSAGAWPGRGFRAAVRRHVAGLDLCDSAIRRHRHLFARRDRRRFRYRPFVLNLAQGGITDVTEHRACLGDPDRGVVEQYSQGDLCRLFWRRQGDRASAAALVGLASPASRLRSPRPFLTCRPFDGRSRQRMVWSL